MRSKGVIILYLSSHRKDGNKFSGSGYGNVYVNVEYHIKKTDAEEDPEYDTDHDGVQCSVHFKKMRENVLELHNHLCCYK